MYQLPWNETMTLTQPPALDRSTLEHVRELLTTELRDPHYTEAWDKCPAKQVVNYQSYHWRTKEEQHQRITMYAAYGIVSLTGGAWMVDHATKETYWYEGDCFPERSDSGTTMCMTAGTFPKRIKAIAHKYYGITLRDKFVATLGEQVRRRISTDERTYYVRLTNVIDWRDGKFGDEGSCYWGDRSGAKGMITGAGGGAVTIYRDSDYREGAARCWAIPIEDGFAIFNSYGDVRLEVMASVLASHLNLIYNRVELSNDGETSGTLYINAAGYYLHPEGTKAYEELDFDIEPRSGRYVTCEYCDEEIRSDDAHQDPDGDWCCDDCYADRCTECYRCSETIWQSEAVFNESNSADYCQDCASRHLTRCDECGECRTNDDMTRTADGHDLCASCLSYDYTQCEACGEYHQNDNVQQITNGDWYCTDCIEAKTTTCEDCGERILNQDSEDWDGVTVCLTCFDQRKEATPETE